MIEIIGQKSKETNQGKGKIKKKFVANPQKAIILNPKCE